MLQQVSHDVKEENHHNYPEDTQYIFSGKTTETKAECHSFIFYKMDFGPAKSKHIKTITVVNMGFYIYFYRLINDQDAEYGQKYGCALFQCNYFFKNAKIG